MFVGERYRKITVAVLGGTFLGPMLVTGHAQVQFHAFVASKVLVAEPSE